MTIPRSGRALARFRSGTAARLLVGAIWGATMVPAAAEAQVPNSGARNITIGYQPGNAGQNGYADAQLRLKYWIAACSSGPSLLVQAESNPHIVVGPHRYWVDGREVQVPPHISPPKLSDGPTVRGTVRGRGISKDVAYAYTTVAPNAPDCWFNDLPVANAADVWKKGATDEEKTAVLREIAFHPSGQFAPLRNSEVEAHFRAIWKQERSDSIARAQVKREEERKKAAADKAEKDRLAALQRQKEAEQKAAAQQSAQQSAATQQSSQGQAPQTQPGTTAPYARDTAGRFYKRTSDGRYTQISEAEYNAGRAQERAEAQRQAEAERQKQQEQVRLAEEARRAESARRMEEERVKARSEAGQLASAMAHNAMSNGNRVGLTYSMLVPSSGRDVSTIGMMYNSGDDFTYFHMALGTDLLAYLAAEEGSSPTLDSDASMAFTAGMLVGITPIGMVVDGWGLMPVVEAGIVLGADDSMEEVGFMDMMYGGGGVILRMGAMDLVATLSPFTPTLNTTFGITLQF